MSVCGQETLLDVREWSEGPPGCPGMVQRPCRMSGSGREASLGIGRPSRMSGNGPEALLDVREWSGDPQDVREWSGGLRACPVVGGRPFRMLGCGRETFP